MPFLNAETVFYFMKNHILCVGSVLLFFILLEVFLSLFWPHKITTRQYHEKYDPVLGWVNKPNMKGMVKIGRRIYFKRTHNSHGLRALREYTYEKPSGVKRILLLGDSFFWGYGVDDEYVISEVLQGMAGQKVEVINGSVTGYGTDQQLLWLVERGLRYRPDMVVASFFGNDLDEIAFSVYYGYPKPYFVIEKGRPVLKNIPVPDTRETRRKGFEEPDTTFGRLKRFLRYNCHTYQFIVGRLNSIPWLRQFFLKIGIAEEFTRALPGVPFHKLEPDKVDELYSALILEIKRVTEEAGARLLLVYIPEREDTLGSKIRYENVNKDAPELNDRFSKGIARLARKKRIEYLDLLPIVREHHLKGEYLYNPYEYDHHWSPLGHRVAAEAIYEYINKTDPDFFR